MSLIDAMSKEVERGPKPPLKKKQIKHPWTNEERNLFIQALEKYGSKSKSDF